MPRVLAYVEHGWILVPAGVWLAITSQLYDRRGPISFAENFNAFFYK